MSSDNRYEGFTLTFRPSDDTVYTSICNEFGVVDVSRQHVNVEIVDQNNLAKEVVKTTQSAHCNDLMPEKVIYNGDTTILISDEDKYIVKCSDSDKFDPVFGFLYGYFLMNNGMSKTQAAKFFKHLEKCVKDDTFEQEKCDKVAEVLEDKSMTLDEYEKRMRDILEEFIA